MVSTDDERTGSPELGISLQTLVKKVVEMLAERTVLGKSWRRIVRDE